MILSINIFKRNPALLKSSLWLFFLRCVGFAQSILTVKIYFNFFNPAQFAFLIVLFSYQIFFSFFDLGVSNAVINRGVNYLVDRNFKALAVLLSGSLSFLLCWTILLNLIVFFVLKFCLLGAYIFPSIADTNFVVHTFLLCSLLSSLRCCFSIVNNYRLIYNQTYCNGIFDSIALIVSIICQIIAVYCKMSFVWHVLIIFGLPLLGHICNLILLCRQQPYLLTSISSNVSKFFSFELKQQLGDGMKFFLLQLASTFAYNSVPIILSLYSKTAEIGMYGILIRLFNPISSLITVFLQPQWSYLSQSYISKKFDNIRRSHRTSLVFVLTACILYLIALSISKSMVIRYLLDNNANFPLQILILFALYIVLLNVSNVYATILNAINVISYQVKFAILLVVLFTIEIILFVPSYGLTAVLFFLCINLLFISIIPSLIKTKRLLYE